MSQARKADVVVVADGGALCLMQCLKTVLKQSGSSLRRLIVVENSLDDVARSDLLEGLGDADSRTQILQYNGSGWTRGGVQLWLKPASRTPCCFKTTSRSLRVGSMS